MSPPYINMGYGIDPRNPPEAKKLQYRGTLCDPQRKTEPTIGHLLAIPEELENCNPLRQDLRNGNLKRKNREDLILTGVDLETFV
ncbi:hypothetical protein U3516DRAFT_737709 [Neocallimastix sp. 'constans']